MPQLIKSDPHLIGHQKNSMAVKQVKSEFLQIREAMVPNCSDDYYRVLPDSGSLRIILRMSQ